MQIIEKREISLDADISLAEKEPKAINKKVGVLHTSFVMDADRVTRTRIFINHMVAYDIIEIYYCFM